MNKLATTLSIVAMLTSAVAQAEPQQAKPSNAEKLQRQAVNDVPHCARVLGTTSIADGDDPTGWTQFQLAAPSKLLKVLVQRSGCFKLVDRGAGLMAAEKERDIGGNLGLQRHSNVGQGQVKAADYVLVAEVQAANHNSQGSGMAAGIAGGLLGGAFGGLVGGIRSKKLEANTVLSLTNVRTTETLATTEGYAAKNDISFGAGGGGFWGGGGLAAVGGGYDNTDIGRIVTLAFVDAYSKLVVQLGGIQEGAAGTAEAAPSKTFVTIAPATLRKTPAATGGVVRALSPGATVYPTGKKDGMWWEVADENDNVGWVLNSKLEPGR